MKPSLLLLFVSLFAVAYAAASPFFLGENHEYGYIPISLSDPRYKIFYWLFKSRSRSPHPPLVLWIEGGPGCASEKAVFLQHGPFHMEENSTVFDSNPLSWNNFADVLYTDQPLGTGLSNCSDPERIPTSGFQAAEDFYGYFTNFLNAHRDVYSPEDTLIYVTGESYAGHFIPAIVDSLYAHNFPYRIGGVLIGNPYIDPHALAWSYPEYAYHHGLTSTATYFAGRVAQTLYEVLDTLGWKNAAMMCYQLANYVTLGIYSQRFLFTDIRGVDMPIANLTILMHRVLKELGMADHHWQNCNSISSTHFWIDHITDYRPYLEKILARNLTTVIYYGEYDYLCSTFSWDAMWTRLSWWGKEGFDRSPERDWWANGVVKGKYKEYGNLRYVKVYNAGHDVYFNQRDFAYDLLYKVLHPAASNDQE